METMHDIICLIADGYHPERYGGIPHEEIVKDEGAIFRCITSQNIQVYLKQMKEKGYEIIWIGKDRIDGFDVRSCKLCDVYYDGIHDGNMKGRKLIMMPEFEDEEDFRMFSDHGKYSELYIRRLMEIIREKQYDHPVLLICALTLPGRVYCAQEPWYSFFSPAQIRNENLDDEQREDAALYLGLCAWFDNLVDQCRKALLLCDEPGRYQLIITTTENGI